MSNITTSCISNNVHVKLQYESEYRRFFIERNTSFQDLQNKIKTILGINPEVLVIKYKDEENEWITLSSDVELETGVLISGNIFRLHVLVGDSKDTSCAENLPSDNPCEKREKKWKKWDCDEEGGRREKRCKKWKKWHHDTENDTDSPNSEKENDDEDCGWRGKRGGKWRGERRHRGGRRGGHRGGRRRYEDDAPEENVDDGTGSAEDVILSLEEIKKELDSLKEELELLKEKKNAIWSEVKDTNVIIKTKRQEGAPKEEIISLREKIQEKKTSCWAIRDQIRTTKNRMFKLRELASTKNN